MSLFNKEDVMKYLPHRDPFLFVDSVEEVIVPQGVDTSLLSLMEFKPLLGGEVETLFYVDKDLSCFVGHFPGNPVFPGVLQVEMMAQTSAFLMTANRNFNVENTQMDVAFLRTDEVRFRKKVVPGMTLRTRAKLVKIRGHICQFSCRVTCNEEIVSEGEIMASLIFKG